MPKVLVIDDDRDICFLMNKFLTKHGYETLESYSAKKALELLEEVKDIDIVLCDYRMEGMDGKTMLLKIKEKYPSMPVIIITGRNDLKTAVDVMKLGAYDYVTKPLFPEEILNTIQSALQQPPILHRCNPPPTACTMMQKKEKEDQCQFRWLYIR